MEKKNKAKSGKKGFWAILKESMNKSSNGCGPECGCHIEKQSNENQQKDTPENSGNDKKQA